jgi:hypothetical protein
VFDLGAGASISGREIEYPLGAITSAEELAAALRMSIEEASSPRSLETYTRLAKVPTSPRTAEMTPGTRADLEGMTPTSRDEFKVAIAMSREETK